MKRKIHESLLDEESNNNDNSTIDLSLSSPSSKRLKRVVQIPEFPQINENHKKLLQINFLPYARTHDYDVLVTLTFFCLYNCKCLLFFCFCFFL